MRVLRIETRLEHDPSEEPCLRTYALVDGRSIVDLVGNTLGICLHELLCSTSGSGSYFIITCACGMPFCAGIREGVRVIFHPTNVEWIVRGHGETAVYYFERASYADVIARGVEQLRVMCAQHPELEVVPESNLAVLDVAALPAASGGKKRRKRR